MNVKRGDVYWIQFDPSIGSEMKKTRPAVIVSSNEANQYLDRFQVLPLSTNISRLYPGEALVTVNKVQSKGLGNQLTTISQFRIKEYMATLSSSDIQAIDLALRVQLGL